MRKLTLIAIVMLMELVPTKAGQDPLYTQFMTNPYLINPGLTGTYDHYQIIANNRIQWIGMASSPITNTISMYGPMARQPMGIGGYIMSDVVGPETKTSINATYAYNYSLTEDLKISMGLMLGFFQHRIDGSKLIIDNELDPVFSTKEDYRNYEPDASVGVFVWSSTYNGGISVTNLFGNKLDFNSVVDSVKTSAISRIKQHIYLHGGYKYLVSPEIAVEPALVLRKTTAQPLQVDFNVRGWYGKRAWSGTKVWGGISYRSFDAINILIGAVFQNKIDVGYSYDIGINNLSRYHSGSHELMLLFRFNNIKDYRN